MIPRRLSSVVVAGVVALATASAAVAQSFTDIGARMAPQYHSYSIQSPTNIKIDEFSVPLFVLVPVSRSLSFDVGSSFARAHVTQEGAGQTTTSNVSGLTDTQVRANYTVGNDFIVLTAGVNLPTGKSTVTADQQLAAGLIGSDFLAFPISNMGTGFGGTGGVAVARPMGDWSVGFGASLRHSASFDPYDATGGPVLRYQPGNEYRVRVGADRPIGTGRFTIGLTYSTFGNDNLAGSIYNTGNRWITQFGYDNTLRAGQLTLVGWNLFRAAGTLADSSYSPHEDVANVQLSYGITVGSAIIEPNIEGRTWLRGSTPPTATLPAASNPAASVMGTPGIRAQLSVLGFSVLPSVGYSFGRLAAQDVNGVNTTASVTGLHAILAIRLR